MRVHIYTKPLSIKLKFLRLFLHLLLITPGCDHVVQYLQSAAISNYLGGLVFMPFFSLKNYWSDRDTFWSVSATAARQLVKEKQ